MPRGYPLDQKTRDKIRSLARELSTQTLAQRFGLGERVIRKILEEKKEVPGG